MFHFSLQLSSQIFFTPINMQRFMLKETKKKKKKHADHDARCPLHLTIFFAKISIGRHILTKLASSIKFLEDPFLQFSELFHVYRQANKKEKQRIHYIFRWISKNARKTTKITPTSNSPFLNNHISILNYPGISANSNAYKYVSFYTSITRFLNLMWLFWENKLKRKC
jgi:hypothetical protein